MSGLNRGQLKTLSELESVQSKLIEHQSLFDPERENFAKVTMEISALIAKCAELTIWMAVNQAFYLLLKFILMKGYLKSPQSGMKMMF